MHLKESLVEGRWDGALAEGTALPISLFRICICLSWLACLPNSMKCPSFMAGIEITIPGKFKGIVPGRVPSLHPSRLWESFFSD